MGPGPGGGPFFLRLFFFSFLWRSGQRSFGFLRKEILKREWRRNFGFFCSLFVSVFVLLFWFCRLEFGIVVKGSESASWFGSTHWRSLDVLVRNPDR
ncbi:hypothetical protein BDV32DRAFT_124575 [Aspergillus pseudonomiae]|nr:hypothetical protein BDV32DRAFT_124575 [Aspergillus pseudonomiae]